MLQVTLQAQELDRKVLKTTSPCPFKWSSSLQAGLILHFLPQKQQKSKNNISFIRFLHTLASFHSIFHRLQRITLLTKPHHFRTPSTIPQAMAKHSENVSHPHNRPGSKCCNLRVPHKHDHADKQPAVKTSGHTAFPGDVATNDNSSTQLPPSTPASTALPASTAFPASPTSLASPDRGNSSSDRDGNPARDDHSDNAIEDILQKMLSPPDSDTEPPVQNHDVQIFNVGRVHYTWKYIRQPPFIPQRPDPSRQRIGEPNGAVNRANRKARRERQGKKHASSGSDGDDEQSDIQQSDIQQSGDELNEDKPDNDSSPDPNSGASTTTGLTSLPTSPTSPPKTPQTTRPSEDTASPTPSKPSKRKRSSSSPDLPPSTSTSEGPRLSKRQRNSVDSSPLSPIQPSKRTRDAQKKFEAKILKDLVFDVEHSGSGRRESVEIKSGAAKWRKGSLHTEPWDGVEK